MLRGNKYDEMARPTGIHTWMQLGGPPCLLYRRAASSHFSSSCFHLGVAVGQEGEDRVDQVAGCGSRRVFEGGADLDLGYVASGVAGDVGPAAEETGELILAERDLPVQDPKAQHEDLPVGRSGLVEPMDQTLDTTARTQVQFGPRCIIMDPAVRRETDPRLMPQNSGGF